MKSDGDATWRTMTSWPHLLRAYRAAARGKRGRPPAASFELRLEENLLDLQEEMRNEAYRPGGYRTFEVREPKRRLIAAAPFRDRVVHHALVSATEPVYERRFIHDSYANRRGKGTHRALDRCTQYMRRYAYVLPMDVRQFYASIDHAILEGILAAKLPSPEIVRLTNRIMANGKDILVREYDMVYFPGDDLLAAMRPRGLPIGNLTSQFWANVYLDRVDQFVRRVLGCRGYVRYADDMLLFADDKRILHEWRVAVIEQLAALRLTAHEARAQPRPCRSGLPFLGFQVFPDHRRLKRRNVVQARRRLTRLVALCEAGQVETSAVTASVQGWVNHARYGDTWGLRRAVLGGLRVQGGGKAGAGALATGH